MEDISSVSSGYEQVCSVILPVLAFLGRKKKKVSPFMLVETEGVICIFLGNKILMFYTGFPLANLLMICFEHI